MSAITLTQAQAQLSDWLAASTAIAGSQEYRVGGVGGYLVKRTDAAEVRKQVNYWSSIVTSLTNSANNLPTISHSVASFN